MPDQLSAFRIDSAAHPNNGNKAVSTDYQNNLLGAIEDAIDEAGAGTTVTPLNFGAVGDGVTDDSAAFVAALAALKADAVNDATIYKGSPRLFIPAGHYYLGTTTLDITHTLIIEGEGSGQAGGAATKLRWAANTTGIRVQRYNTSSSGTVDGVTHYGGDATVIQNLLLYGAFTDLASEGAYHGVHLKARALVRDCFIQNWQGNGINIVATTGGGAGLEGNANQFQIERCTAWYCQNGIYIDGADANAGYTLGCDTSYNRQWGIWDTSFLGNAHYSPHAANNGFADNGLSGPPYLPPTLVSYSGNRYFVLAGQEAGASTNAPSGTTADNTWWGYAGSGGVLGAAIPAWSSGATYRTGGPYRTDDPNASVVFTNAYTEGGQSPPQFLSGTTTAIGGLWGTGFGNQFGGYLAGSASAVSFRRDVNVGGNLSVAGNSYFGPAGGVVADGAVYFRQTNIGTYLNFQTYDTSGTLLYDDGYIFADPSFGMVFNGRSASLGLRFRAAGTNVVTIKSTGLELWAGKNLTLNGVTVLDGATGNIVGTGTITSSGGGIGYATGAGGTISQLTSRSTGVTLNKLSGNITLFSTTTAAAQFDKFTLTNSQIAANDVVVVTVKTATGKYIVSVLATGTGSCDIGVYTPAAVGAAEAPVLNFAVIKAVNA